MKDDNLDQSTEGYKLTEWPNEPSVRDLKQDFKDAESSRNTQVAKVDNWLDNLNVTGAAKINVPKGNSSVQPKLIRKQAEWRYPALSEPFLSSPDIFNVSPVSWEDKKAAQQNQILLNNQFNTKIKKVKFIDEFVRTAVEEGTVILRVGWDFEEEEYLAPLVSFVPNPALAPMYDQLSQLQASDPSQYQVDVPEELKEAHQMSMEQGIPYEAIVSETETVTKTRTIRNNPTVEVCDYRNITLDPTCKGDVDKANFIVYSFETSMAELERDGRYKNLKAINVDKSVLSDPDHTSDEETDFNFSDKPRKKFVVHEYWGFWDVEGNGKLTPIVAAWAGDVLIRMEENPFPDGKLPFVVIPYSPVRRSGFGEPDGELLVDNQKIVGAVTRGMIDLLAKSANGQTGIRKDMLDATNRRKFERGQDYEFNQNVDPRQGVHMHTFPEIPASAQYVLDQQNGEAEAMTGARAFGATNTQGIGDSATAARDVMDAASKREVSILRRLAEGMIEVGRKFIAMNAVFLDDEEVVRVTNEEFVPIRRDDLAGNFDLRLTISTAEEDNKKAQELAFMLQTGQQDMDPGEVRIIRAEIARLRKMPELAKRIEEYQPQPDPLAQEKLMLENELLRAQIAATKGQAVERQAGAILDQAKAANVSSDTDQKNLDFVEQESGVKQERELQKQSEQARGNMQLKLLENSLRNYQTPKKVANG